MRKTRLSVPGCGRSLAAVTEQRAKYIRKAVEILKPFMTSDEARKVFLKLLGSRWQVTGISHISEDFALRASWALVNMWVLGRSHGSISARGSFSDAENWFLARGGINQHSLAYFISADAERDALTQLRTVEYDTDFEDLLPYILDPYGPGSRLNVLRDHRMATIRKSKKEKGFFYTPTDVTEFIVDRVFEKVHKGGRQPQCFDPACGTGPFILAILKHMIGHNMLMGATSTFEYVTSSLYGFDISDLTSEICCFVLLYKIIDNVIRQDLKPLGIWHLLRTNIVSLNALYASRESLRNSATRKKNRQQRKQIKDEIRCFANGQKTNLPEPIVCHVDMPMVDLSIIYPEVSEGFDVIVGNPPYASIGNSKDTVALQKEYASIGCCKMSQNLNMYPLFIEMMWRLARPGNNASGMVVPLSIAYHKGRQYRRCRSAISLSGGLWQFAFFDREPHALFGEEAKTRNTIIFHFEDKDQDKNAEERRTRIDTTSLLRWTSRTRDTLFKRITFVPLDTTNIDSGIPKLGNKLQANVYQILYNRPDRLETSWNQINTCLPSEASIEQAYPRLFVASTAYNFINVYRNINIDHSLCYKLSTNTLFRMDFANEEMATVCLAILSSRIVYWLWQIECDAFHVPKWFLESIPFSISSFSREQCETLAKLGEVLWAKLQGHQIVSVNSGKYTIGFRPLVFEQERDYIDNILAEAAKLPKDFLEELKRVIRDRVVLDENDSTRKHLLNLFSGVTQ